jgi:hypothetical protein
MILRFIGIDIDTDKVKSVSEPKYDSDNNRFYLEVKMDDKVHKLYNTSFVYLTEVKNTILMNKDTKND